MKEHQAEICPRFLALVSELERERGHKIGGFAFNEKEKRWKIITPEGKVTLLDNWWKHECFPTRELAEGHIAWRKKGG